MIFSRMSIENLGVFRGRSEWDLTPSTGSASVRPIVLFGGMNGAGKTTIFEAFRLALYGSGAFWPPISHEAYETEMRNRLARHPATVTDPDRATVELDVQHSRIGTTHMYTIRREWDFSGRTMRESLEVLRDKVPLEEVGRDLWQEFIWDLMPPGLSRLFFFDGEKIQALAEDDSGTLSLAESFRSLVGLDLVDRLTGDLEFVVARELRNSGTASAGRELGQIRKRLQVLEEKRTRLVFARASLQTSIDAHTSEIERREKEIAAEGGGWASQRAGYIRMQSAASAELESVDQQLREIASGLLPLSIVPDLCARTQTRISRETDAEQKRLAAKLAESAIGQRLSALPEIDGVKLDSELRQVVTRVVQALVTEALASLESEPETNLNELSSREAARVSDWLEAASRSIGPEVSELTNRRELLTRRQQDLSERLARVPSERQLAPLVAEFNDLHEELSALKARQTKFDLEIGHVDRETEVERKRADRVKEDAFRRGRLSATLENARRVGMALKEFQQELTRARMAQVTKSLEEAFKALSRKKSWLGGIQVDPETFSVTLLDKDGRELPKERLAAGEKQIYAIALLWALAKTSGRGLPFIIDTPLGRLDSLHRRGLVRSFLPFAGEQVVVFSTDTEIDRSYFDALSPYIAKCYHLVHDDGLGLTRTESGYFWRGEIRGAAS